MYIICSAHWHFGPYGTSFYAGDLLGTYNDEEVNQASHKFCEETLNYWKNYPKIEGKKVNL